MSRRFVFLYVAPVVALLVITVLPLVSGARTLFLRDVFNTHLPMKAAQAQAMRAGYFPLLDPPRAGAQPLAGNPNAVAFHPDNLLYLIAPLLWAFNAHFWIHLLLAPFAMYALGRAFDLDPPAAWAAATTYALSGFFLSQLAFYNLVAGVALLPAFLAAALRLAGGLGGRLSAWWPAALLWTLLLVSGDPLIAAFALALAVAAVLARRGWRPPGLAGVARLAAAVVLGTLVAAPAVVEFLRILPLSFRGHWGYPGRSATIASFDPRQAAEWLLPLLFGRPDRLGPGGFWGHDFYTGVPAYYFSLYPGLLAFALLVAGGWPRARAAWWAWGTTAVGVFFALGRFNPAIAKLYDLPGAGLLRYPVKFWTLAAPGLALLCGLGFARLRSPAPDRAPRRFGLTLALAAALFASAWALLSIAPALCERGLRALVPPHLGAAFVANERLRWAGLCLFTFLYLGLLILAWGQWRRGREWGAAALLVLHAGSQLFFLRPLFASDQMRPYLEPSPVLAHVGDADLTVHGAAERFGTTSLLTARYPDRRVLWLERRAFHDLYPVAGSLWGRRYELNTSPEGLDSFLARLAVEAMRDLDDERRLRLLRAWGVTRLLLDRELEPAARSQATLVAAAPSFGQTLRVYAPLDPAPELVLARRVESAPNVNAAFAALTRADFDARGTVVIPGDAPPRAAAGGAVRVLARSPESISLVVVPPEPTVLLWQRAHLEIYRAEVDGEPAPLLAANVYRLGLRVPAGRHQVRIYLERRPLRRAAAVSLAAVLVLAAVEWRRRRLPASAGM